MKVLKFILVIVFGVHLVKVAEAQSLAKFPEGSRIAFVGNSITEAGFYESYIWLYYATRFPDQRIEVINAGIGGNTVKDMVARFDADVLARKPTVIVLTFGMNDSGYFEYNGNNPQEVAEQKVEESHRYFVMLEDKLKSHPEIQKIMMASSPYDETMKNKDNYFPGKSKALERIVAFQKEAAANNHWPFADLYYPMQKINQEGQKVDPAYTLIGKDRIHPGNGGHLVMAYLFLSAQGLKDVPVADVKIDARKKKLNQNTNADIDHLTVTDEGLSFDYLAKALPFPIDSASRIWGSEQKQSDALAVVPFMEEFDQEKLTISNLSQAKYELKIDGESMGSWTKEEFAKGINLALITNTPQYKQAVQVMNLNQARKDIEGKLREYYGIQFIFFEPRGMLFKDDQAAYDIAKKQAKTDWMVAGKIGSYESLRFPEIRESYKAQMKLIIDMMYNLNQPKKHTIEVVVVDPK